MEKLDPVAQGRVQILGCPSGNDAQAMAALDELIRLSELVPDWSWNRAAVISRDWRKLLPVRDFAEAHGLPVEMANENLPGPWRTREMQAFIGALRKGHGRMVSLEDLTDILNAIPPNRWTDRIGEGLGLLARETDGKAMPSPDVIEWFAEWARDSWGEQRGLKLLTAHRAKGLEFDDVVILDGGWEKPSRNEDQDAPRRLFYVAMTRARRNLIVMSNDNHEYLPTRSPLGDHATRGAGHERLSRTPVPFPVRRDADGRSVIRRAAGRSPRGPSRDRAGTGWGQGPIDRRRWALANRGQPGTALGPYGESLRAAAPNPVPLRRDRGDCPAAQGGRG